MIIIKIKTNNKRHIAEDRRHTAFGPHVPAILKKQQQPNLATDRNEAFVVFFFFLFIFFYLEFFLSFFLFFRLIIFCSSFSLEQYSLILFIYLFIY